MTSLHCVKHFTIICFRKKLLLSGPFVLLTLPAHLSCTFLSQAPMALHIPFTRNLFLSKHTVLPLQNPPRDFLQQARKRSVPLLAAGKRETDNLCNYVAEREPWELTTTCCLRLGSAFPPLQRSSLLLTLWEQAQSSLLLTLRETQKRTGTENQFT